jgi:hypothetical protein
MNEYNFNTMPGMFPNYGNNIGNNVKPFNVQPNMQQTNVNTNKIYVNGIDDARSRYVPANADFIFVDTNEPILYRKVTDGSGRFDVKAYDIIPREINIDKDYVSRKEFESLQKDISTLKEYLPKVTESGGN